MTFSGVMGFSRSWHSNDTSAATACVDTNVSWRDSNNLGCDAYDQYKCNDGLDAFGYFTPDAIESRTVCCVCGGGEQKALPTDESEEKCMLKCLQMETCTGIMHAPLTASPFIAGECWIATYENPDQTIRSGLWLVKDVQYRAPQQIQKFCADSTFTPNATEDQEVSEMEWKDRFGRTCNDYRRLGLCGADGVNFTWVSNSTGNSSNLTNASDLQTSRTMFYPYYGIAWDFLNRNGTGGESFDAVQGAFGSASDACCGCGKQADPLGYNVFARRHDNVTLYPESIPDLLCSPDAHNYQSSSSPICVEPMELVDNNGTFRCCVSRGSSFPVLVEKCQGGTCIASSDNMTVIDYEFDSAEAQGFVRADGYNLRDKAHVLPVGHIVRLASTNPIFGKAAVDYPVSMQGAILRPIVEGSIFDIQIENRGFAYTVDPHLLIWPVKRQEHHNLSRRIENDDSTQYFFQKALLSFEIGFAGNIEGTFDGTNLDFMCATAPSSTTCLKNPYGDGFGPCLALTRAHGGELAASTSVIDFANETTLDTSGASGLVAFRIHDVQYLVVANYLNKSQMMLDGLSSRPFSSPAWEQNYEYARKAKSQLFRLAATAEGRLETELVQEFETVSAHDVSYSIVDGYHMLAFAQEVSETSALFALPASDSSEALFIAGEARFELIQRPPTQGARTMKAFTAAASIGGESFFLISQTQNAQECAIEDVFSTTPSCGMNASALAQLPLGNVLDLNLEAAQSMMLRWNGTQIQGTNVMETLPKDLGGLQAFRSHDATDFVPFRSREGSDHVVLLNSEGPGFCEDNPVLNCSLKYGADASGRTRCVQLLMPDDERYSDDTAVLISPDSWFCGRDRCVHEKAFRCDQCPSSCGTCALCNSVFNDAKKGIVKDRPVEDIVLLGVNAPCGAEAMMDIANPTQCPPDSAARECFACPVACGTQGCIDTMLGGLITPRDEALKIKGYQAGSTYGISRNRLSYIKSVRHEKVAGLQGPSSVLVSPDGLHVYVGSYSQGSILCYNRNTSTGLLVFDPNGGVLSEVASAATQSASAVADKAPTCENSADDCSGAGYLYHGLKKMVMTRDGEVVYAVSFDNSALHTLRRDTATGKLTPLGAPLVDGGLDDAGSRIDGIAGANDVFLSHDERSVYVAGFQDQSVAYFIRNDSVRQGGLLFVDRVKNGER